MAMGMVLALLIAFSGVWGEDKQVMKPAPPPKKGDLLASSFTVNSGRGGQEPLLIQYFRERLPRGKRESKEHKDGALHGYEDGFTSGVELFGQQGFAKEPVKKCKKWKELPGAFCSFGSFDSAQTYFYDDAKIEARPCMQYCEDSGKESWRWDATHSAISSDGNECLVTNMCADQNGRKTCVFPVPANRGYYSNGNKLHVTSVTQMPYGTQLSKQCHAASCYVPDCD